MRILFVCAASLALMACTSKNQGAESKRNQTSLAERGLSAEVSSVSLADDCPESRIGTSADCAEGANCSLPCQQTSMQMSFESEGSVAEVTVKILEVRLFAKETGDLLDTLSVRAPSRWVEENGSYQRWEERLPPDAKIRAKYDLSGPNWSEIDHTRNTLFFIEVDVEIDGTVITVESGELSREPEIVT